jgi:hypothetical protein
MPKYWDEDNNEVELDQDALNLAVAIVAANTRSGGQFAQRMQEVIDDLNGDTSGTRAAEPYKSTDGDYPAWTRKR